MNTQNSNQINGHCLHVLNWFFPYGDIIILETVPAPIMIPVDFAPAKSQPVKVTTVKAQPAIGITLSINLDESEQVSSLHSEILVEYHANVKRQMKADELTAIYRQ